VVKDSVGPELSIEIFRLIRELLRDYCGIFFDDNSRGLLQRRLLGRLKLHNLNSFSDYYRFLLFDKQRDEEFAALMDILTVNETYFFREKNQLLAFSEEILSELKEKKGSLKRLRIFSAGCSTGEEPYTLAILIQEKNHFRDWDVEIIGGDINRRVLQVARKGIYRQNSFRATDPYYLHRYFEQANNEKYKISEEIKKMVKFSYINILDPFKLKFLGMMDVVFCRNVLIYFDNESKKKAVDNLYNIIQPGGYLLLGHAESLINVSTSFILKHLKHDLVYQKPEKEG
jgi:chemotaxis protein methyltransferase CheR